jgi:hypothetical protein
MHHRILSIDELVDVGHEVGQWCGRHLYGSSRRA